MACYRPLKAWKSRERNDETGKYGITFNPMRALMQDSPLVLACGQCIGCRADKAQAWGIRCRHEAQMHDASCFFTLTYDEQNVPADFSVKLSHWQAFMRRTRKRIKVKGLRFAGGGEYGEHGLRPHYHGLFFNYDFPDKKLRQKRNGYPVYTSELLGELWPLGSSELGSVTHASAEYCSRYTLKKITGKPADDHYWRVSPVDGEAHRVEPEFFTMSRRPGLGSAWFDRYGSDAFAFTRTADGKVRGVSDFLIVDGRRVRPPAFYLNKLEEADQKPIKRARKRRSIEPRQRANSTAERLKVREFIKQSKMKRLAGARSL